MASSLALHNAMVSSVIRGFQRFRGIELQAELVEQHLLEARMIVASSLDDQFDDEWAPSPEEIAAARDAIYSAWSDDERERRRRSEYVSTRMKRQDADFHYQSARSTSVDKSLPYDFTSLERRRERQRRYEEKNREAIRDRRQDPAYKEKEKAWKARYREVNKFRVKETHAANRAQYNETRRRKYAENIERERELLRTRMAAHYAANRDEINARRRELRLANSDQLNARQREQRAKKRATAVAS